MGALDEYSKRHETDGKRKGLVMCSYVMIDKVNDSLKCAKELCELLKDKQVLVNLIPFNSFDPYVNNRDINGVPTVRKHPAEFYQPSEPEAIQDMLEMLNSYGIRAYERRPHGRDISAACGQLAKIQKKDGSVFENVGDIEEELNGCSSNLATKTLLSLTDGSVTATKPKQRKHINSVVPLSREVVKKKQREKKERRRKMAMWGLGLAVVAGVVISGLQSIRRRNV